MATCWPAIPLDRRLAWIGLLGAALIVLALGTFARFHDLGGAPLAEDEYFTARSIEWILEHGVPAIPSGGYYIRGPLFQYAAAGFAWLFGADAFAYRLPSALLGLAVGVLGFFYARRHGGLAVGLAVATALFLSSWAIEFSRFVRFYSLFQAAVLLFLISLDKAYFEAREGWRYVPHAMILLASLAHEMAVLLAPFLFLPLLPGSAALRVSEPRRWVGFALVSLVVTLVVYEVTIGERFVVYGVSDRYPADFDWEPRFDGPFAAPALPFFRLLADPFAHVLAVVLIGLLMSAGFLLLRWRGAERFELPDLLLALALLMSVFHLFAAVALVLVFAVLRYDLWRLTVQPVRRLVLLGATLAVGFGWLAVIVSNPGWVVNAEVVARWGIAEPGTTGAVLRGVWSTFFGWPDFYRPTIRPFARELPELGVTLIVALGWFALAHRHAAWSDLLRHPGAVVVYWALATALFTTGSTTSRYWLPILPVLYTLIPVSLLEAMTRLRPHAAGVRVGASLVFLLLFALGPDFQPRHLVHVGDDAVRFRADAFARFDMTWYPRRDVRTAAATVARRHEAAPDARIVVDTLLALSYYLEPAHAVYLDRENTRFMQYSRERGSREMWSDRPLLDTPRELLAYAAPAEELWLVREIDPERHGTDLEALTAGQLTEVGRSVLGEDGRIELIRLRPNPAR